MKLLKSSGMVRVEAPVQLVTQVIVSLFKPFNEDARRYKIAWRFKWSIEPGYRVQQVDGRIIFKIVHCKLIVPGTLISGNDVCSIDSKPTFIPSSYNNFSEDILTKLEIVPEGSQVLLSWASQTNYYGDVLEVNGSESEEYLLAKQEMEETGNIITSRDLQIAIKNAKALMRYEFAKQQNASSKTDIK